MEESEAQIAIYIAEASLKTCAISLENRAFVSSGFVSTGFVRRTKSSHDLSHGLLLVTWHFVQGS